MTSRTAGQRLHYKMTRLACYPTWDSLDNKTREAFNDIAINSPELVPTEFEIQERDAEMIQMNVFETIIQEDHEVFINLSQDRIEKPGNSHPRPRPDNCNPFT